MHTKFILIFSSLIFLFSCAQTTAEKIELSNPGFGVIETSISAITEGVDIPVLLNSNDVIKGIQFTLSWDPTVGQVLQPTLTSSNPGFTISSSESQHGEMKVLIFSMSGDIFTVTDPEVMKVPVRIIDEEAPIFKLFFNDAIFAGPSSVSYQIPVEHANLRIDRN